MRRRVVIAGIGALLVGTAGCSERVNDALTFSARPVTVPATVRNRTGYHADGTDEWIAEQSFRLLNRTRTVSVHNQVADYSKAVGPLGEGLPPVRDERTARFSALSSPKIELLGRDINPIGNMSASELAAELDDRFPEIAIVRRTDSGTTSVLGTRTRYSEFLGEVDFGLPVLVALRVIITEAIESRDDFVVTVGAVPRAAPDEEVAHLFTMMDSLRHGR